MGCAVAAGGMVPRPEGSDPMADAGWDQGAGDLLKPRRGERENGVEMGQPIHSPAMENGDLPEEWDLEDQAAQEDAGEDCCEQFCCSRECRATLGEFMDHFGADNHLHCVP